MRAAAAVEIGERDAERHADRRQIRRHPLELALLDAVDGGLADAAGLAGERLRDQRFSSRASLMMRPTSWGVMTCGSIPEAGYLCLTLFQIDRTHIRVITSSWHPNRTASFTDRAGDPQRFWRPPGGPGRGDGGGAADRLQAVAWRGPGVAGAGHRDPSRHPRRRAGLGAAARPVGAVPSMCRSKFQQKRRSCRMEGRRHEAGDLDVRPDPGPEPRPNPHSGDRDRQREHDIPECIQRALAKRCVGHFKVRQPGVV